MAELKWTNVNDAGANAAMSNQLTAARDLRNAVSSAGKVGQDLMDVITQRRKEAEAWEKQQNTDYALWQMNQATTPEEMEEVQNALNQNQGNMGLFGSAIDLGKLAENRSTWEIKTQQRAEAKDSMKDFSDAAIETQAKIEELLMNNDIQGAVQLMNERGGILSRKAQDSINQKITQRSNYMDELTLKLREQTNRDKLNNAQVAQTEANTAQIWQNMSERERNIALENVKMTGEAAQNLTNVTHELSTISEQKQIEQARYQTELNKLKGSLHELKPTAPSDSIQEAYSNLYQGVQEFMRTNDLNALLNTFRAYASATGDMTFLDNFKVPEIQALEQTLLELSRTENKLRDTQANMISSNKDLVEALNKGSNVEVTQAKYQLKSGSGSGSNGSNEVNNSESVSSSLKGKVNGRNYEVSTETNTTVKGSSNTNPSNAQTTTNPTTENKDVVKQVQDMVVSSGSVPAKEASHSVNRLEELAKRAEEKENNGKKLTTSEIKVLEVDDFLKIQKEKNSHDVMSKVQQDIASGKAAVVNFLTEDSTDKDIEQYNANVEQHNSPLNKGLPISQNTIFQDATRAADFVDDLSRTNDIDAYIKNIQEKMDSDMKLNKVTTRADQEKLKAAQFIKNEFSKLGLSKEQQKAYLETFSKEMNKAAQQGIEAYMASILKTPDGKQNITAVNSVIDLITDDNANFVGNIWKPNGKSVFAETIDISKLGSGKEIGKHIWSQLTDVVDDWGAVSGGSAHSLKQLLTKYVDSEYKAQIALSFIHKAYTNDKGEVVTSIKEGSYGKNYEQSIQALEAFLSGNDDSDLKGHINFMKGIKTRGANMGNPLAAAERARFIQHTAQKEGIGFHEAISKSIHDGETLYVPYVSTNNPNREISNPSLKEKNKIHKEAQNAIQYINDKTNTKTYNTIRSNSGERGEFGSFDKLKPLNNPKEIDEAKHKLMKLNQAIEALESKSSLTKKEKDTLKDYKKYVNIFEEKLLKSK